MLGLSSSSRGGLCVPQILKHKIHKQDQFAYELGVSSKKQRESEGRAGAHPSVECLPVSRRPWIQSLLQWRSGRRSSVRRTCWAREKGRALLELVDMVLMEVCDRALH